ASEERALIDVLRSAQDVDDVLPDVTDVDPISDFLKALLTEDAAPTRRRAGHRAAREESFESGLFRSDADFLLSGLTQLHPEPGRPVSGRGVDHVIDAGSVLIHCTPNQDLSRRLDHLPQSYISDRRVKETVKLTSHRDVAEDRLRAALDDGSGTNWPDVHYLGPLHQVLDWMSGRIHVGIPS